MLPAGSQGSHYSRRSRRPTLQSTFIADAKEKHGMPWTTLRGLKKLSMQTILTFAAMNLKKLATWTWELLDVDSKSLFSRYLSQLLAVY
jgi:hypothetical protein